MLSGCRAVNATKGKVIILPKMITVKVIISPMITFCDDKPDKN